MLRTGPRQIGHVALANRGASTTHRQRWPHGLIAIVGRRSKHTTHIGSAPPVAPACCTSTDCTKEYVLTKCSARALLASCGS